MFERIKNKFIPKEEKEKEKALKEIEEILEWYVERSNFYYGLKDYIYTLNYRDRWELLNLIKELDRGFEHALKIYRKFGGTEVYSYKKIPFLKDNEFIHKCSRCNKKHIYTKEDIKEATIEGYYTRRILWHYSEPQKYEQDVDVVICQTCGKKDII